MLTKGIKIKLWQGLTTLLLVLLICGMGLQFWGKISGASQAFQMATVIQILDGDTSDFP